MLRVATVLALSVLLLLPAAGRAQEVGRTISVAGEARFTARNDAARVGFAVRARARTRPAAVGRTSARLRRVLAALRRTGIADRDVRTGSISVARRRNRRGRPVGPFEARQGVRATVRDARRAGAVVAAAVRAGAAPVEGPTFFVSDPSVLFRRALAAAFSDARRDATQLAEVAGLTLGRPITIRDSAFQGPLGSMDEGLSEQRGAAGPAPPTRPGRSVISATVFVVFEAH